VLKEIHYFWDARMKMIHGSARYLLILLYVVLHYCVVNLKSGIRDTAKEGGVVLISFDGHEKYLVLNTRCHDTTY
jgi:hypothetical protein